MSQLVQNLQAIQDRIAEAAKKANRSPEEITLIAVSKTKPMNMIQVVFEAGQLDFGENKVQELREKHPQLPQAQWHLIGHLQRNKVKYIAPFVHLIHSVDSERLLEEINKQAAKNNRTIDCLLQLNISDEFNKSGLDEVAAENLLGNINQYPNVAIKGLMGMAEFTDDMQIVRSQFKRLAKAFQAFKAIEHPRIQMKELSMGMSGDFELAIEEGATMVRIGSSIFGYRNYL